MKVATSCAHLSVMIRAWPGWVRAFALHPAGSRRWSADGAGVCTGRACSDERWKTDRACVGARPVWGAILLDEAGRGRAEGQVVSPRLRGGNAGAGRAPSRSSPRPSAGSGMAARPGSSPSAPTQPLMAGGSTLLLGDYYVFRMTITAPQVPELRPPVVGGVADLGEAAREETAALRRASEILNDVLHSAQRRLAERAVASATAANRSGRKARPQPIPFVDLTPYEGMADRDVLLALGARKGETSYYKKALQRERTDNRCPHPSEGERCQAGVRTQLGLRCRRTALPSQSWCRQHHPDPPADLGPAEHIRERLRHDQLWQRPDGRVLEALYALTDSVQELTDTARQTLDRARRLEAAAADKQPAAWLNAEEAASYTRRSRSAVAHAANSGELSGVRQGHRGSWSFRPADLDSWLESGSYNSGRYSRTRLPSTRRRTST